MRARRVWGVRGWRAVYVCMGCVGGVRYNFIRSTHEIRSTFSVDCPAPLALSIYSLVQSLLQTASGHQLGSITSVCPSHRHRQKMPGAWVCYDWVTVIRRAPADGVQ